jgi:hypothetical protein
MTMTPSIKTTVLCYPSLLFRASIIRCSQPAGRNSTSAKSELERREGMREKEAGGKLFARL